MSIELIRQKQKSYQELEKAVSVLGDLLLRLPIEDSKTVAKWLNESIAERRKDDGLIVLMPSDAILSLLAESPGLLTQEIIRRLDGKIETTSSKPERIIYTALFNLKKSGKIVQDKQSKQYHLRESG